MAQLSKNRSATLKVIHDLEKSETKILFSKWDCSKVSVRVMGLRRKYLVICSILDDLFGRQNPCFLYIAPAYCCGFLITNMKSTKYFLIHLYLLDTWVSIIWVAVCRTNYIPYQHSFLFFIKVGSNPYVGNISY